MRKISNLSCVAALFLLIPLAGCSNEPALSDIQRTLEVVAASSQEQAPDTASGADQAAPSAEESVAATEAEGGDGTEADALPASLDEVAASNEESPAPPLPGDGTRHPSDFLDSYRVTARFAVTSTLVDGALSVEQVDAGGIWRRADNEHGYNAVFTIVNTIGDLPEELVYVLLDDHAAVKIDGQWTTLDRYENDLLGDPNSLFEMPYMAQLTSAMYVGEETMIGVPTFHYQLTNPAQFVAMMGNLLGGQDSTVADVTLDGWVAQEGYVVRYELVADIDGALNLGQLGASQASHQTIAISYGLAGLNSAEEIVWPEDAPAPGVLAVPGFGEGEFPIPEGAATTPGLGMIEIQTGMSESETYEFYATELAAHGWEIDGEYGVYTATRDGHTLNLLVRPSDTGAVIEIYTVGQ
ncbi:MAG: hypothetical protein H3C34_09810 [Caldilineaceae bacterium]|nr:hypothetical protein [Caldilineaceae bacterium]